MWKSVAIACWAACTLGVHTRTALPPRTGCPPPSPWGPNSPSLGGKLPLHPAVTGVSLDDGGAFSPPPPSQHHTAPAEIRAGEEPESNHPAAGVAGLSINVWSPSEQGEGAVRGGSPIQGPYLGSLRPSGGSGGKGMAGRTGHGIPGLRAPEGLPGLVIISAGSGVHELVRAPAGQAGAHLLLLHA